MRKQILSVLALITMAVVLSGCDSDPKYIYGYFDRTDNITRIADSFEGEYEGKMNIIAYRNNSKAAIPNSIWKGKWSDEVDSAPIVNYYLGGHDNMYLTIESFPISAIGYVVPDDSLGAALRKLPDCDLTFPYTFKESSEYTDDNKLGIIMFADQNVNYIMNYGGEAHIVTIKFCFPMSQQFNGASGPYSLNRVRLEVSDILVDGKVLMNFSGWDDGNFFYMVISGENDGHETVEEGTVTKK